MTLVFPCHVPPAATYRRTRRGFLGSDGFLSCVMCSPTPAEWHRLAITTMRMLPWTDMTVSASAILDISWLNDTPHMTAVYASDDTLP